jgi:hypothetical protein
VERGEGRIVRDDVGNPQGEQTQREKPIRAGAWFKGTFGEVRRVVRPVLLDVPTRRFSAMRHALKRDYGTNQIPNDL